jgi:hypothetical protein
MNENIIPQHNTNITLNVPIDHPFVNIIGTDFYENEYLTNRCLFNYNGVLYCYVYDNIDLLTSFKNNLEDLQYFNLQKLQNTEINNKEKDPFKLFALGNNDGVYLCVLEGEKFLSFKTKHSMQTETVTKINGPRNFIFLYNSKG